MFKKSTIIFGLLLVCAISFAADFTGATIVYPDKQTDLEKNAVSELRGYLESATGKEFQELPESSFKGGASIHVGATAASLKELGTPDKLEKEEWRIKDSGDKLFITGGSPNGVLFGVYDFLNRQGIYSIAPGSDAIPKIAKLEVKDLDVKSKPAFYIHSMWPGLYYTPMQLDNAPERKYLDSFLRRNYCYGTQARDHESPYHISISGKQCHSFYDFVPPEKYAKTHPEYYAMNENGNREWSETSQLCLSNPEVRRIVKEQLLARIASDRAGKLTDYPVLYDFSQNDSDRFCTCEKCQAIVKKYGSNTGNVLEAVNEIADAVAKKYPDVFIQSFAYINTEAPLETIKPAKNVVIKYCDLFNRSNCFLPLRKQPGRAALVKKWCEQCPNVYVWDYWNLAKITAKDPGMIVDAVIDDIRFFRETGVNGLFVEAEVGCSRPQSFIWLQYFLAGQLIRDPSADAEKLIDIFIRNYYGNAAPEMRKYFDFLRAAVQKNPNAFNSGMLDVNFLKQASEMLENALKAVGSDPAVKTRVLYEKNIVDYALINKLEGAPAKGVDRESVIKQYCENMIFAINNNPLMSKAAKEKYLKINEDEVFTFNLKYPLPDELSKYPAQKIRRLPHSGGQYYSARIVHDAASEMPESLAWLPADPADHKLPFGIGIYDHATQQGISVAITPVSNDEKYHWYKLGRFHLGRKTVIWATHTWQMSIRLSGFYVDDEGLQEKDNPNVYDVWVDIRFAGPKYIPGSKSKDCVYIDKVVLARPLEEIFGEIPQELANVPKEKIIPLGAMCLKGKVVADEDSPTGKAAVLTTEIKGRSGEVFSGVWSPKLEEKERNTCSRFLPAAGDEKYHWHKIDTGRISRDAYIYFGDWSIGFNLKPFWKEGGSNRYEFWVSMKTQGPPFVKDSKRPRGIYVDRAILVEK